MSNYNGDRIVKFPHEQQAQAKLFSAQLVIFCTCGFQDPLMLIFLANMGSATTVCPACHTSYHIARFEFDATKNGTFSVGVAAHSPKVVTAG